MQEDVDLWRALFSSEEQDRKFMLFSDILEQLPPATNGQQALGRFIMEVSLFETCTALIVMLLGDLRGRYA